jgi:hypothetical protein
MTEERQPPAQARPASEAKAPASERPGSLPEVPRYQPPPVTPLDFRLQQIQRDHADFLARNTTAEWPAVNPPGSRYELYPSGVIRCNGTLQPPENGIQQAKNKIWYFSEILEYCNRLYMALGGQTRGSGWPTEGSWLVLLGACPMVRDRHGTATVDHDACLTKLRTVYSRAKAERDKMFA